MVLKNNFRKKTQKIWINWWISQTVTNNIAKIEVKIMKQKFKRRIIINLFECTKWLIVFIVYFFRFILFYVCVHFISFLIQSWLEFKILNRINCTKQNREEKKTSARKISWFLNRRSNKLVTQTYENLFWWNSETMVFIQRYNYYYQQHFKQFSTMDRKYLSNRGLYLQFIFITLILCLMIDISVCDYENTWNFYYEQPCCGNSNGHHLRHHRGK